MVKVHITFQFSFNRDLLRVGLVRVVITQGQEQTYFQFSFNRDLLRGFGVLFFSSSFSFMRVFYFNFSFYFKTWSGRVFKSFISDRI